MCSRANAVFSGVSISPPAHVPAEGPSMVWNSRSYVLPRQPMPSAALKPHLNKMKDPLWPAIPSRITLEDPPLLAQVSKMMKDAQPVQALRDSFRRDRVAANVSRKISATREKESKVCRKRGRRCGTANSALEQAYLPAGVAPAIGLRQQRSRSGSSNCGSRSRGLSHSSSRHRGDAATPLNNNHVDGCRRAGDIDVDFLPKRGLPGSSSEPILSSAQSLSSDITSLASHCGFEFNFRSHGGSNSSLSSSSRTAQPSNRQPHEQRHLHRNGGQRNSAEAPTTSSASHGGGDTSPTAALSVMSSRDADSTPLPGVCYITYPPTPDLAAVSLSSTPAERGLDGPCARAHNGGSDAGSDVTQIARARRRDSSAHLPEDVEEEAAARSENGFAGADASPRERHEDESSFTVGSNANASSPAGSWQDDRCGHGGIDDACGPCRGSGEGGQPQRAPTEQLSSASEKNTLKRHVAYDLEEDSGSYMYGLVGAGETTSVEGIAKQASERRAAPRRQAGKSGSGSGGRPLRCGQKVISMMISDGHPLVASRGSPSLPGVDEHQLPPFWLAEMHDNMRKNRAALKTPFRHRAVRARAPAPSPEDEANAFDDLGEDGRSRLNTDAETELTMVVSYFMAFGSKGGRDGLTLQDLEAAFRASRRADAFLAIEKKGKAAFSKCLDMLKAHELSSEDWIQELLSKRKQDRLTTFDMGESIRGYNRAKPAWVRSHKHWLREFMISEKDIRWCQRFVDPDGNTDIDEEELSNAVRSALDGKPRMSFEESRAVELILEFENFISTNRIRLVDLFERVDKDKGGTVDGEELREFLKLGRKTADGDDLARSKERKEKMEEEERDKARNDFVRKAKEAKERHTRSRETGVNRILDSLKTYTKTKGLRLSDMIQATGAHPDEGMYPSQLLAFFERATGSSLDLTKESLEKIVQNVDEDGDGLLSLSEIQLVLTQHTQDEILLRRLAKAVALHVARTTKKTDHTRSNVNGFLRQPRNPTSAAATADTDLGCDPESHGRHSSGSGGGSRGGGGGSGGGSLANGSTVSGNVARGLRWSSGSGGDSSGIITPEREHDEASNQTGLRGPSNNADHNYKWILYDESSIDRIASMEGIELCVSKWERRHPARFQAASSAPRTAFKVQAGSNLDSSWLPGFDQRFEFQRLAQGQRVVGGSCTWYTN